VGFEGVLRLRKREVLEEREMERERGGGRRRRRGVDGGAGDGGRGPSMGGLAGEDEGSMMVVSDEDG